jgi:hypothetical protein
LVIVVCVLVDAAVAGSRAVRHDKNQLSAKQRGGAPELHARSVPEQASPGSDVARGTAIRDVLSRRARALLRHDRAAFLGTVDPQSKTFRAKQATYFNNIAKVPLSSWSYTLEGGIEAPNSGSQFQHYFATVWVPHVRVHYKLAGFDHASTAGDAYFTFVQRGSRWYIGSDSDAARLGFGTTREIWDFGPVLVVRGKRSLVLGHPTSRVSLRNLADEVDRAIPRVTAVWGSAWSRVLVALVPRTESEMEKLIPDSGDLSRIAAVATAEITGDDLAHPVGDRVIVNPANYTKLSGVGRRIVITHETTHVASRSATGRLVPTWLVEGFADYVGYGGTGVSTRTAAHELRKDLQRGRAVGALPTDKSYAGTNKRLSQAYEKAWLACRYIADKYGQAALLRFYRAVGAETVGSQATAVDRVMRRVLRVTLPAFTAQWAAYVRAQLA